VANLVAASVPGLAIEAVRIVDQHGRLLSQPSSQNSDRLELQSRMESKLRAQIAQLLTPMLGEGNFSSETQGERDMNEETAPCGAKRSRQARPPPPAPWACRACGRTRRPRPPMQSRVRRRAGRRPVRARR